MPFLKDKNPDLPMYSAHIRLDRATRHNIDEENKKLSTYQRLSTNGKFSCIVQKNDKIHKMSRDSDTSKQQLLFEIKLLQHIDHQSIVKAFPVSSFTLTLKYYVNGSIYDAIISNDEDKLKAYECHKHIIIQGLACGVDYLHQKGIVHRDIKAENCLLDDDMEPKITDFGFAVCLSESADKNEPISIKGTPDYIAPEILSKVLDNESNMITSMAQDIFALGILFLEIAWKQCINTIISPRYDGHHPNAKIDAIKSGTYLKFTNKQGLVLHHSICDIIVRLCAFDPKKRPSSESIVRHTRHLKPEYCSFFKVDNPDQTPSLSVANHIHP